MVMCSNGIISSDPTSTIFDPNRYIISIRSKTVEVGSLFQILLIYNNSQVSLTSFFFCILFFFLIRHISPTHSEYFLTEQSNIYLKQLLISFENLCIEWRPSSLVNWLPLSQTLGGSGEGGGCRVRAPRPIGYSIIFFIVLCACKWLCPHGKSSDFVFLVIPNGAPPPPPIQKEWVATIEGE